MSSFPDVIQLKLKVVYEKNVQEELVFNVSTPKDGTFQSAMDSAKMANPILDHKTVIYNGQPITDFRFKLSEMGVTDGSEITIIAREEGALNGEVAAAHATVVEQTTQA